MSSENLINDIWTRMVVRSSDGTHLGHVTHIYRRDSDAYLEVTPRANLWKPWQLMVAVQRLFLPGSTVTAVEGKVVHVSMDAKTAKGCTSRPNWNTHRLPVVSRYIQGVCLIHHSHPGPLAHQCDIAVAAYGAPSQTNSRMLFKTVSRTLRGETKPPFAQAHPAALPDDQMIKHVHIQQLARFH